MLATKDIPFFDEALKKAGLKGKIILEPNAKNTTAAILIAAFANKADEYLLILPADHFIPKNDEFIATIKNIKKNLIIISGIHLV